MSHCVQFVREPLSSEQASITASTVYFCNHEGGRRTMKTVIMKNGTSDGYITASHIRK